MEPHDYFLFPGSVAQKQYEALRMYFLENRTASEVARQFGYTYRGFTTIVSDFRKRLKNHPQEDPFFYQKTKGRKKNQQTSHAKALIVALRKKYYSVEDIKVILDSKKYDISEKTIYNILHKEGFSRLPRRLKMQRQKREEVQIPAEKSQQLSFLPEEFKSADGGILCLLPYIKNYGIDQLIEQSGYPQTTTINRVNAILSFIALKASNVRRYTADNLWCMDRGVGLFAGLNVLPKASWYSSYSHRVTPQMNREFLKALHEKWLSLGLLSDTANLDLTTIPYWGDGQHLENNWSGKRGKALSSMLSVLAHDPDSGIIDYGQVGIRHKNESDVVLEFLDFYRDTPAPSDDLKYLVFDSKFTNYQNLDRLNKRQVNFITIRRRGKNMVDRLEEVPASWWKTTRVEAAGNKKRSLKIFEENTRLKGYEGTIRQINVKGHGKIKPAIIITNDFDLKTQDIVRKYTKRWIVEKSISEQIEFFHLNNVSSSMVIKVDFDLTMSIVTHNLFRLIARDLEGYNNYSDQRLYEDFLKNSADIKIDSKTISINLKKKRNLPLLLETLNNFDTINYPWLNTLKLNFKGASYS
ncbi:MAG: transposase [Bacteroidales bacterium]